jgi:hypothetical protein
LPPCSKKKVILLSNEICKYTHFFPFNLAVTNKPVGGGEKLLSYLNSALKVLSGLYIFPRGPKKKLNFVDQCNPHDALFTFSSLRYHTSTYFGSISSPLSGDRTCIYVANCTCYTAKLTVSGYGQTR